MPVYDYLHAVNPIKVGTDKMQATMKHATAGLKITLTNKDGNKMDASIASARILVGNIASRLDYYTAEASGKPGSLIAAASYTESVWLFLDNPQYRKL